MKTTTRVSQLVSRFLLSCLLALVFMVQANAQISVSGGSGLSATYTSFTKSDGLFAALNAASQTGNSITVSITGDIATEDGTASLNAGAWTSINVTPTGARTVSGSYTGNLFNFNGADNVTINGLNASGNSLSISNTNTTYTAGTIRFINDATSNTITNCTLKSAGAGIASGVVVFATGITTGNDNNTISNNNITASTVGSLTNGIFALGTAGKDNSGIQILNNNIYDFFKLDSISTGVFVSTNNTNWTINNNKLYQQTEKVNAASFSNNYGINVVNTGENYTITGNIIGGDNSTGSGQFRFTASTSSCSHRFCAIQLSTAISGVSTISNNTIANIYIASFSTFASPFANLTGISVIAGSANIDNNTIGATTGATGSLYAYNRAAGSSGGIMGIYTASAAPAVVNITNNNIGNLAVKDSLTTYGGGIYGIYNSATSASMTVSGNTIGNTTANNIWAGTSGSTTAAASVMGIYFSSSPAVLNCYSNTVQNLIAYGNSTGTYVRGIGTGSSFCAASIYNNTINNLSCNSIQAGISSGSASAVGIVYASTSTTSTGLIYGNTVTNISNTNTFAQTSSVMVAGIVNASSATGTAIYKNTIYGLSNAGTGVTALQAPMIAGVVVMNSTVNDSVYNNMISLGTGVTTNTMITGIWLQRSGAGTGTDYILHNTVNITGTQSSGSWSSFGIQRGDYNAAVTTSKTNPVIIKNNIFTNSRTGGTTNGHYAISNNFGSTVVGATTLAGWTSNYNILNSASASTVGWHGTAAYTFTNWKAIATMLPDANSSTAATVTYSNSATDLHINMGVTANVIESTGDPAVYLLTDFDGQARPGPVSPANGGSVNPDLGADEFDGKFTATCSLPGSTNATTSAASVSCYNTTVTLGLSALPTGTGNSYQWQLSTTSSSAGFSNIAGAVTASYVATPTAASNYYRCIVTCAAGPTSITSASITVTGPTKMAGTYTINNLVATGGTNYQTFKAAFADLSCKGVSDSVRFNVLNGPFTEQDTLNAIAGASAVNKITIKGNLRTFMFSSTTSTQRAGIVLNGANWITIDSLKIDTVAGSTYNWGIWFTNNASNNTIKNCVINVGIVSTASTNTYGIAFSSSNTALAGTASIGSNNTITNNIIKGGYHGIALYGNTSAASLYGTGNVISNNILTDFFNTGISCLYNKNTIISGNDLSRPNRSAAGSVTAYSLSTGGENVVMYNNRTHNMFDKFPTSHTNSFIGVQTAYTATLGNEGKIYNNVFYNISGSGNQQPIYIQTAYTKVYHNTVFLGGATTVAAATYGIYTSGALTGSSIVNNMVYINRGTTGVRRCIYVGSATTATIDYNNYFVNTTNGADYAIGQFAGTPTLTAITLASWQTANSSAYDAHSFNVEPLFVDTTGGNFTPTSATIDEVGTPVGILTDINATVRSTTDPDIGAYEFASNPCNDPATAGASTSSATTVCSGSSFTLGLSGTSVGSGQRYLWQDSVIGGTWHNLTASVQKLQTYTTNQTVSHWYRCIVQCNYPSGTNVGSTPIYVYSPAQLNGSYTINKSAAASSTNFVTFADAIAAMNCGITGPVTFDVLNGPYNEQVILTAITGANTVNRVRFNGNGQTLSYTAGSSTNRCTFGLNGASYITLDNLVIDASTGIYGTGVWIGGSTNLTLDTVSNCTINLPINDATANYGGIVMSTVNNSSLGNATLANNIAIIGNTINGGYSGIVIYGTNGNLQKGNVAINNTIKNTYNYAIYIVYVDSAIVRGNNIYATTRSTYPSSYYGIQMAAGATQIIVDRNKIHNVFDGVTSSTITFYAISVSGSPTATKQHYITNNLIYGINHDGAIIGIQNIVSGAQYTNIYHNSIIFNNTTTNATSNTDGIWLSGIPSYNNVKNNLVYIARGGTGTKRCIYRQGGNTSYAYNIFDRNNLYLSPTSAGTTNYLVVDSAITFTDINVWKAYPLGDPNAQNQKVIFTNIAAANFAPASQSFNNLGGYVGVDFDINGNTRSNTTPDIGAYEFDIVNCTTPPTAGTVVTTTTNACNGDNFTLDLTNNSVGLTQSYQWEKSANGSNGWASVGTASTITPEFTTSQTTNNYYRCKVTCSGQDAYSNVVLITTPDLVSGNYTIDKTQGTSGNNFASFAEAISYISCGINGPVTFTVASGSGPYNTFTDPFIVPAINGTSAANTITFNGNGETITFSSTISSNRNAIALNGADWVTITGFNIDLSAGASNASGYYATGICLTNNADNNTITNCTIDGGRNTTNTTIQGIMINGSLGASQTSGNSGSNNLISSCSIVGTYEGIVMHGITSNLRTGNQVINNTIVDAYNSFIYSAYNSNVVIRGNDMYRTSGRSTFGGVTNGIYMAIQTAGALIEKNKIHDFYPASAATNTGNTFCLYMNSNNTTAGVGTENKVYNNLIYNMNFDGPVYGLYSGCSYTNFYHNTVVLDYVGAATTVGLTYGIYHVSATNTNYKNNNIYVTRGSTGGAASSGNRGISFGNAVFTGVNISNNNFYFSNSVSGSFSSVARYNSVDYTTISSFETAYTTAGGTSANNVSVNPSFINAAGGNYAAAATALNGVGATNLPVSTDILGNARITFFTPGAYEVDNAAPTFSNSIITQSCSGAVGGTSAQVNGVVISDVSGVQTTGANMPRIYYRKGTSGAWSSAVGTLTSGNALSGTWNFSMSYAAMGGVANGNTIYYFIAAQDVYVTPNLGSNATGLVATSVSSITTYPTTGNAVSIIEVTPTISIATAITTVCSGNTVLFSATATNTGSSPIYQWKRNGVNAGSSSTTTFPANTLVSGDVITCELTSSASCLTTTGAIVSNPITLTVLPSPTVTAIKDATGASPSSIVVCAVGSTVTLGLYASDTIFGSWSSSNTSAVTVVAGSAGISPHPKTGVITSVGSGTAVISYSIAATNGCTSTASVNVIVDPQAAPSASTGTTTLCVGSSTTLSNNTIIVSGSTSAWSVVAGRATINSAGLLLTNSAGLTIVRYTITNSNGCSNYTSLPITINPLPSVPNINYAPNTTNPATAGGYCTNRTFTLVGTPATSASGTGVWSGTGVIVTNGSNPLIASIGSTTGIVKTASSTGAASIRYTYTNTATTCVNSRTISSTIVPCASRQATTNSQQLMANEFSIYPNPAKSFINLQVKTLVGAGNIVITDLYGKQLKAQSLSLGSNTIDVSTFAKGMYLVSVITSEGKKTEKLIVE